MTGQASADKIEITEEMIEAGVSELVGYSDKYESEEDAVIRIYRAMELARVNHGNDSLAELTERPSL